MSMGIHRLDLDQMLDLDMMNIGPERRSGQDKSEESDRAQTEETGVVPADQIKGLHPKLKSYRPEIENSRVHHPSLDMKSLIGPATDMPWDNRGHDDSKGVSKRYSYDPNKFRTRPTPPPSFTTPPPMDPDIDGDDKVFPSKSYPSGFAKAPTAAEETLLPNYSPKSPEELPPRIWRTDKPDDFDPKLPPEKEKLDLQPGIASKSFFVLLFFVAMKSCIHPEQAFLAGQFILGSF